jgi:hypothetical protein
VIKLPFEIKTKLVGRSIAQNCAGNFRKTIISKLSFDFNILYQNMMNVRNFLIVILSLTGSFAASAQSNLLNKKHLIKQ